MAKGIRALLDTVMQALPQVGNLGLLFFLLFFIFAALGVELFGRMECSDELPCQVGVFCEVITAFWPHLAEFYHIWHSSSMLRSYRERP